jgi:alpha-aminoadipate carrier protein LysW
VPIAVCPECDTEIHVEEDLDKGETMACPECDAKLEVVGLDPIELDAVVDKDDEDEDEDDY